MCVRAGGEQEKRFNCELRECREWKCKRFNRQGREGR
jgi:hypothetical protein